MRFGNVAIVHLYPDRISSSNDWIPFSTWHKICDLHPMLALVIVVDHLSLVLILRCPPFLLLLMSLMTLMMSEPPGFQSPYETLQKNFVPFDKQQISKQFEENPPWPCLQVFWSLKRVPRLWQRLHQPVCLKSFLAAFWFAYISSLLEWMLLQVFWVLVLLRKLFQIPPLARRGCLQRFPFFLRGFWRLL